MGENNNNTIDASSVIKEEWKDELKLIENYIFDEITKKIDTYDIEDIVKSCVEKSDGIKEILKKLNAIESMLVNLNNLLYQGTTLTNSPNSWGSADIWSSSSLTANGPGPDLTSLGDLLSCYTEETSTKADSSTTECGK